MKKQVILFILPLTIVMLLFACSTKEKVEIPKEEQGIAINIDAMLAENVDQMVKETPLIVVGSFERLIKHYNAAYDPKDPTKEAKNSVGERKLFDFRVDKVLKGSISSKVIQVSQPYRFSVTDLTEEQVKARVGLVKDPYYFEPEQGKRYVLFLRKAENPPPSSQDYYGSFVIHVFSVSDDQKLSVVKPDPRLSKQKVSIDGKTYEVEIHTSLDPPEGVDGLTLEQLETKIKQRSS